MAIPVCECFRGTWLQDGKCGYYTEDKPADTTCTQTEQYNYIRFSDVMEVVLFRQANPPTVVSFDQSMWVRKTSRCPKIGTSALELRNAPLPLAREA